MPKDYVLFVNEERTIKVEIWPTKNSDGESKYDFVRAEVTLTVATREDTADVWGPPIEMHEEK